MAPSSISHADSSSRFSVELKNDTGSEKTNVDVEDQESRKLLEKKLLRKVDLRMSILVVIYILNYVSIDSLYILTLTHRHSSH